MMKGIFTLLKGIGFILVINLLLTIAIPSQSNAIESYDANKINRLQEKVAKNYSNKFCNAIGIGISKDGAIRLAINENKDSKFNPGLWFELASSGKANLELIDKDQLAEVISKQIVIDCGSAIGLSGATGVESFTNYFVNIRDNIDSE